MDFNPLHNPLNCRPSEIPKPEFIFRRTRSSAAANLADQAEEEAEEHKEEFEREAQERRHAESLQAQIARSRVSDATKQTMRRCLASESLEMHNLVEEFLQRERFDEEEFARSVERREREDASWNTIFTTQREIRKRIQEVQWRAHGYAEITRTPRRKSEFEALLKEARGLNRQDDATDRGLKQLLQDLMTADPAHGITSVLNQTEANEIYSCLPGPDILTSTLNKYRGRIQANTGGDRLFQRLIALKREEQQIEAQFDRLCRKLEKIIQEGVSKVRRKEDQQRVLEEDSKIIGITLKEGTEIEFSDAGILSFLAPKRTVKISRVVFDEVEPIRDRDGKVIERRLGIPRIRLDNGANFTIGRFKKWVDAVDAVEKISTISDVEKATGLKAYGIDIKEGISLSYPRRRKDERGEVSTQLVSVTIAQINRQTKKIHFSEPVLFQPGFETGGQYDMRDSLSFGEFVKWWHRYEVEKSVSLHELRELLRKHNEIENKEFGIEASENPPILLQKEQFEELYYPDESETKYRIMNFDDQGVVLDGLGRKTLPEFWYWVKNNHVRKVPARKMKEEEVKLDEALKKEIGVEQGVTKEKAEREERFGRAKDAERFAEAMTPEKTVGGLTDRLKKMWWETQLLSFKDIWNMILQIVEFVKRKHQRRSKGRFGDVGSRFPWVLGTEFEREKQAAADEEVEKYKAPMDKWGVAKVKKCLYATNSKDEAKACILTLRDQGELRWDDHKLWKTLNRLTARYTLEGARLLIPEPQDIPAGKSGEDMARDAVDALWGIGKGSEWYLETINKYNSHKNTFEYKFKQLESDPKGMGGPAGECQMMIKKWKAGEYVNPMEYEAMIDGAIKYGKMTAEQKLFYIFSAILARAGNDPHGETLWHIDRLGELDSKYLNAFPLLDFFTQVYVEDKSLWDDKNNRWGRKRKLNLNDYTEMMLRYFKDEFDKVDPGPQFARFLWEMMVMDEAVRTRISKGIRNAENMDHDDAHLYIPPATPTEIDNLMTGPTGQKKYFTNEGYANGYSGFSQYLLSLSYALEEEPDESKRKNKIFALRDALSSFVRYDAILDNRFLREEGDRRARLDDRHYNRSTVVDGGACILRDHQNQLRNLFVKVGQAYGKDWSWLYQAKCGYDTEGRKRQALYERKVNELKDTMVDLFMLDNGQKALEVINQARSRRRDPKDKDCLMGITGSVRPKLEEIAELNAKGRRNVEEWRMTTVQGRY